MPQLELQELIELVYRCLGQCKLIDVALFVAHRTLGKAPQKLADQTGLPLVDVEARIEFVEGLLMRRVRDYQLG